MERLALRGVRLRRTIGKIAQPASALHCSIGAGGRAPGKPALLWSAPMRPGPGFSTAQHGRLGDGADISDGAALEATLAGLRLDFERILQRIAEPGSSGI
jgi:hypothetical protein